MLPSAYFAPRYFAGHYFPAVGAAQAARVSRQGIGILRMAARPGVSVIGPSVTLSRTTPGDPSHDASTGSGVARTAYVVRNAGSKRQQAANGVGLWASDWILVAPIAQDIQSTDKIVGGAYTFVVMASPETDRGVLLAPVDKQ